MPSLKAKGRKQFGKKVSKLRKEGILPAVLYGRKIDNTSISVRYADFDSVYKEAGESALVTLDVEGNENIVLIRDVVVHPISRKFIHADFHQIPMDEEITITVPIEFEGEAPAVKDEGAVFIRNVYELELSALPKNLLHEVRVDLSPLEHIGDSIVVKDVAVPEGVNINAEEDLVLASVEEPQEEIIEEEAEEEVAPEDIKTEAEEEREKKEEEAEEAEEKAAEE